MSVCVWWSATSTNTHMHYSLKLARNRTKLVLTFQFPMTQKQKQPKSVWNRRHIAQQQRHTVFTAASKKESVQNRTDGEKNYHICLPAERYIVQRTNDLAVAFANSLPPTTQHLWLALNVCARKIRTDFAVFVVFVSCERRLKCERIKDLSHSKRIVWLVVLKISGTVTVRLIRKRFTI